MFNHTPITLFSDTKTWLIITAGSILCALIFWFWLLPQQQTLQQLQHQRHQYFEKKYNTSQAPNTQTFSQYKNYQNTPHTLSTSLATLALLAVQHHLILKRLAPQTGTPPNILLRANAKFIGIFQFIQSLNTMPAILMINHLELENEKKFLQINLVFSYEN